jgi:hypothetical protein
VARFKARYGLTGLSLSSEDQEDSSSSYGVALNSVLDANLPLIGLKASADQLGDPLQRCANAIQVARKTGLKYVLLGGHEAACAGGSASVGGVTLLPGDAPLPAGGIFLSGPFDDWAQFAPVLDSEESEDSRAAKEIVLKDFINRVPRLAGDKVVKEDAVAV